MVELACWIWRFIILKTSAVLLVTSATIGEEQRCEILTAKFALEDLNTVVDTTHKQLIGTWLSEGCEIRPGPQYLLRSYTFREDGTYKLIQHHYWDSSCSLPKLTITSTGLLRLSQNLVHNPDTATGFVRPINITLIPQGAEAAKELSKTATSNCPDLRWHQWKKYEEYLLYNGAVSNQDFTYTETNLKNFVDIACFDKLRWTFSEVKFIKIQIRPIYNTMFDNPIAKFHRLELLLGDASSTTESVEHISMAFQPPLIKWTNDLKVFAHGKYYKIKNNCGICPSLQNSDTTPPHLLEKPELPPYIDGHWVSMRCEIRSMGFYLTRRFSFSSTGNLDIWSGEHKFYLDPFCAVPKFSVTTAGDFKLLDKNAIEPSATNIDLNIRRASLTIFDRKMSEQMSKTNACNVGVWEVDIPYELNYNYNCSGHNLVIPSTQRDIVKLDINYEGSSLLFLGLMHASTFTRITQKRPTSYQEALIKCTWLNEVEHSWDSLLASKIYLNSSGPCVCRYSLKFLLQITLLLQLLRQT